MLLVFYLFYFVKTKVTKIFSYVFFKKFYSFSSYI